MRNIWSTERCAHVSFRRPVQAWRACRLAAVVCLPLLGLGCSKYNRSNNAPIGFRPTPISTSASTPPATMPADRLPVLTEQELEAQAQRLQRRTTRLQNELEQQVLPRVRDLDQQLGDQHVSASGEGNVPRYVLEMMLKRRLEASQELAVAKARLKAMDAASREGKPWPQALQEVRQDARYQTLRQRLDAMDIELAVLAKDPAPDKSAAEKLKRQRDAVQQRLDVITNEMTEAATDAQRQQLEERALTLDQNIFAIDQQAVELGRQLGKINQLNTDYLAAKQSEREMREEIRASEQERNRVLEKLDAMRPPNTKVSD